MEYFKRILMASNNFSFIGADKKNTDQETVLSTILSGKELTNDEFKAWIEESESKPTVSLQEAINKWAKKKEYLQQSIK